MALTPGAKIGSYEIQSPLGAGGMGEVYRATQSSLGRQVAIKVLASATASDPERLRRFEQEARSASALNHPNIISIYDVGRENATAYIAMEFVDGRTLRDLLESGPLGIKKSLQISAQIADGLAKAHAANIVHRDLKPENVMVTRDGFVKILDFGLAKLMPGVLDGFSPADSQTMTAAIPATHPGMVMGTAGYMSPEQARGAELDYRSDIFSFGSILYEMVTGKQPFKAASSAQTLAAIIEDEPTPIAESNPRTPAPLRWVIERCMAKDREDRYSSTRDLAQDLKSIRDHLSDATSSGAMLQATPAVQRPKWLAPVVLGLGSMILGAALMAWLRPEQVASPPTLRTLTFSGTDNSPSVSPDGRTVAFISGRDGTFRVWLKQLESGSETVLTAGPNDDAPHFSPDGASVLYIHQRAAYRIPSIGGEARKLVDNVDDANWSPDGHQIVFVRGVGADTEIGIATAADGSSRVIHRVKGEFLHLPSWSPDGSTIALTTQFTGTAGVSVRRVLLISPDANTILDLQCPMPGGGLSGVAWTRDSRQLVYAVPESPADVGGLQPAVGSSGHVLLQDVKSGKARTLFAVQAPVGRIEIAGPGRLIFDSLTQRANLKYFSNAPGEPLAGRWLTRGSSIDRQPYISPDGQSVLFSSSRSGDVDIWEVSAKTNAIRRLTDHPASDWDPYVTRDNQHLLWSSNRTGHFEIWTADRDGSSPRQVSHDGFDAENPTLTPDGWVVYASGQPEHPGVWKVRLDGTDAKLVVPGTVAWPDVSPDGKYALYHVVNTAVRAEIHVVRLADGSPVDFHVQGARARFAGDGTSIIYMHNEGTTIARQDFLSGSTAPAKMLVPASPDQIIDTFHSTPDGHGIVVSYAQPAAGLVVVDGVAGITGMAGTK